MSTVVFLGHAGMAVEADRFRILIDPWLSPAGAFLGSWHQFPRNDHLDVPGLLKADWVAVSHEHLDHMDPWVLGQLPPKTRVLIPEYPASTFRDRITALAGGRSVIELKPWQRLPLDSAGSWITAIPESSPMCHDSALLVVADGRSVLHCNDARLTAAQARRAKHMAGGRLDMMAVQAALATWHPICYEYSSEEIARISVEKRISKLRAVHRLVRATEPTLAVPFAGPPCFLDPELRRFNATLGPDGLFCDAEAAVEWLAEHLPAQQWAAFRPGDRLDLETGERLADPVSAEFSYTVGIEDYLDRYAADRGGAIAAELAAFPAPGPEFGGLMTEHFSRLGTLSEYFLARVDMTVRFVVTGVGTWDVAVRPGGVNVAPAADDTKPGYRIVVDGRWLAAVLTGCIAWEDLLLSLRLSLSRDPDVYNDHFVGLLKHANAPALAAVEMYETGRDESERITVSSDGSAYEIPRYCPHAGEDLSVGAIVEDGRLHCLGHNFVFDLQTGRCLNARCDPLR
jgi:nitrite reductase/ring-hydroxylating ferredoxin subunit